MIVRSMRGVAVSVAFVGGVRVVAVFIVAAFIVAVFTAIPARPAHAEIFKCVSKERRVTFQDSPCIGATGTTVDIRPQNSGVVVVQPTAASPQKSATKAEPEPANTGASAERATQAQRDAAALKSLEADRKRRTLEFDLGEAETALEALKSSMDQDLAGLRARKESLSNSVPGSVLETSAASDLLVASERYQLQIRATQDRIAELRKSRDDLTAAAASPKPDVRAGAGVGAGAAAGGGAATGAAGQKQ